MRRLFLLLTVSVFALQDSVAYAQSSSCYGCNIVDTGQVYNLQQGQSLYIDNVTSANTRVLVLGFDEATQRLWVRRSSDDQIALVDPTDLYSYSRVQERDAATWGVGALAVIGTLLAIGSGSSSNSSSPQPSRQPQRDAEKDYVWRPASPPPPPPPSPKPDTSVGCAWGDRAYGTCH
jgi:hypothetical protein